MLLSRVLTAAVLLPLAIAGILYLPLAYFALVLSAIFFIGAQEWVKIAQLSKNQGYAFILSLGIGFMLLWLFALDSFFISLSLMLAAFLFWLLATLLVTNFPDGTGLWDKKTVLSFTFGWFTLIPSWYAMVALKGMEFFQIDNTSIDGGVLVLLLMCSVWIADTGAYFSGRKFGKIKLMPEVSPGKTREGAYGAIILAVLSFVLASLVSGINIGMSLLIGVLIFIIVCFSILGDLFESMYKRQSGIKDSGNILPGHGGVLDRIDSLTAAAPIFFLMVLILQGVK